MSRIVITSRQILDAATGEVLRSSYSRKVPRRMVRVPALASKTGARRPWVAKLAAELMPLVVGLTVLWSLLSMGKR